MKWEPLALMGILLALGMWLVLGGRDFGTVPRREGATVVPLRVANGRGLVETARDPATGAPTFRVLLRGGWASGIMTAEEFGAMFGARVLADCAAERTNAVFRALNITSWWSLAWVSLGLASQLAFSGRTIIQWVVSEKRKESVVPPVFWWLSLAGGAGLFTYFVWRQDVVGVLGQSSGIVIYARNLRLIAKQRRRERGEFG